MTAPQWIATEADDERHPPADPADPWAIETVWFAFTVPEQALNTVVYLCLRPYYNTCALHINVFDASGAEPWNNRYWRSMWHLPIPATLREFTVPEIGLQFEVLEPLTRYRLRMADEPDVAFDVTWEALMPPRMSSATHIDQAGHITGSIRIGGVEHPVDCLQMRDRSWTHRPDTQHRNGGYTYGLASADLGFLTISDGVGDTKPVVGGWYLRDGDLVDIVSGTREILARRPSGEPTRLRVTGVDQRGREFTAEGELPSRTWTQVSGNILGIDSVAKWSLNGVTCWGEDQDVWSPRTWHDQRPTLRDQG
jgi:hypothetical protein